MSIRPERSELLMPAGSLEKMKSAILYGADAVYAGTPDMSLRTKSAFSLEELMEGIEFAHEHGVRVYLTLNLYAHNKDIEKLPSFIETIRQVSPDGVIIADPAVFQYVKEHAPEIELHVSTQANITSWMGVKFWEDQGAKLAVLAREVTYEELCEIREKCPNIKLEAFVHGAMCMTYSGRCLLSNFMAERGSNQGNCAQSCRWQYKLHVKLRDGKTEEILINEDNKDLFEFLVEENMRPGELMPIEEDLYGNSYIFNSKDLCLMPKLDDYLKIGVDSLKVEGRHKNAYYAGAVARAYRQAIDDYYANPESWDGSKYMKELETIRNRGYTLAFHEGRLKNHSHDYETTASMGDWSFGGSIVNWDGDDMIFEIRSTIRSGDVIEFLPPRTLDTVRVRLYEFERADNGYMVDQVNPGQKMSIRIPASTFAQTEDLATIKERMPVGTIARTETLDPLRKTDRIKVRIQAHKMESGKLSEKVYENTKQRITERLKEEGVNENVMKKEKQVKDNVCCGRGCNGCMVFWHDEKYAKAREILSSKKMGERLDKQTAASAVA